MKKAKISDLIPDDKNFNQGNAYGNSLIEKSLRKFGAGRSILLDKQNRIIAGNKATENAGAIGMEDVIIVDTDGTKIVAVRRNDIDLDTPQGREMALADNATAKSNIIFDVELIEDELPDMELEDWGLVSEKELEAEEDDYVQPDDIEVDVVLGDLIEIGKHRLLCGDSTDSEQINNLMNGVKGDILLTDPPYGINADKGFDGAEGFAGNGSPIKRRKYDDDWDLERPTKETFSLILGLANDSIIFGGNFFADLLPTSKHWLVWDKLNTMPTFGDCELAWTNIDRNSVKKYTIEYNGLIGKEEERFHPTQKPIKLFSKILLNYSNEGSIIMDVYLGSGTTMVASHQLNRTCYGMELDPKYCQVIIDRMLKLDPDLPVKINGKSYVRESREQKVNLTQNGVKTA